MSIWSSVMNTPRSTRKMASFWIIESAQQFLEKYMKYLLVVWTLYTRKYWYKIGKARFSLNLSFWKEVFIQVFHIFSLLGHLDMLFQWNKTWQSHHYFKSGSLELFLCCMEALFYSQVQRIVLVICSIAMFYRVAISRAPQCKYHTTVI